MKRFLLVCCLALAASAGTARADGWVIVSTPVSAGPNADTTAIPSDVTAQPAQSEQLSVQQLLPIWKAAGAAYSVPWTVLAAINKIESNFGENMGPSSAGAIGWMQFMPDTWRMYGTDANNDGVASPWSAEDAIYSAARYLAASGAQTDLRKAVFAYNHAGWYVDEVMNLAAVYAAGGADLASAFTAFQVDLSAQKEQVAAARAELEGAVAKVRRLERARARVLRSSGTADLISERLDAQRRVALLGVRIAATRHEIARLRGELAGARNTLASARAGQQSLGLGPSSGYIAAAPTFQGSAAFPVGGSQELVSVARQAVGDSVEISAPAGSPVFAYSDLTVVDASPDPNGDCGIGATLRSADGQSSTYCHLAYLDGAVTPGAALSAGTFMGLVGQTGAATGPGLELKFQGALVPAQLQSWFAGFAGSAFRWQEPISASSTYAVVSSGDSTLNSAAAFAER
jgi:murein DD-endopeptidase MepM/ murein hydrolase activator NlpD